MIPFLAGRRRADHRRPADQGQRASGDQPTWRTPRPRRTRPRSETTEDLIEQMRVHALEILLAPDLVDMVSGASDDLLARVRALRRKIAMELGIVVPPVRTRDSVDLPSATYVIRIAGVEAGRGLAPSGKVLALGDALDSLPGVDHRRAGVRAGRQVGAHRAAAQRRNDRRDGHRPGLGAGHAPVLDHHRQRGPAAHPGGRARAHRGGQEREPVGGGRTDPGPAVPGRGAAGAARACWSSRSRSTTCRASTRR